MKLFGKYGSFGNWFSYNGKWVALAAALILFVVYTTFLQPADPEPDQLLVWAGTSRLSQQEEQSIVDMLTPLTEDENGDGQVLVGIDQYIVDFSLTSADPGFQDNYSHVMKLLAQLQTNQCYLLLLDDPERFQTATGSLQFLDGSLPADLEEGGYESERWEEMCVPFDTKELEHTCWLARRAIFDDTDPRTEYPGADDLFEAIAAMHSETP